MRKQRDVALDQAEKVNSTHDAMINETAALKKDRDSMKNDRDALLAERNLLAEENKRLRNQSEVTRQAHDEEAETFSRLSDTQKNMSEGLEQLREEVVPKRMDIDTQADSLDRRLAEKQSELNDHIHAAQEERNVLHDRLAKESRERRKLFNMLQELRGNIRVYCRVRPGRRSNSCSVVKFPRHGIHESGRVQLGRKMFDFDQVFQPHSTQVEVYDETAGVWMLDMGEEFGWVAASWMGGGI